MVCKLKRLFVFIIFLNVSLLQAQFEYGVKAGLNYDSLGDIDYKNLSASPISLNSRAGYHIGIYGNFNLPVFYLRPEIQLTKSNSSFNGSNVGINKIDAPILLGYNILGPLSVFAGPSFQYILSEDVEKIDITKIEKNFTVGLQLGVRLTLGRIGVSLRYERGFTDNEISILDKNNLNIGKIDTRPKQFIISASYQLKLHNKD